MKVSVVVALAARQEIFDLELAAGATLADALSAAALAARFPGLDVATLDAGVWGKACPRDTVLRDGDRVELYRALLADPKDQRRARARSRKPSTRARSGP